MDLPFTSQVTPDQEIPSYYDNHITRLLSSPADAGRDYATIETQGFRKLDGRRKRGRGRRQPALVEIG